MMKCMNTLVLLAMSIAFLAIALSATSTDHDHSSTDTNDEIDSAPEHTTNSRFLANNSLQGRHGQMTCNEYPRVCRGRGSRGRGSPGPDCCNRRCVNVMEDRFNCGKCGKMCRHREICCGGRCVNPLSTIQHCGGCYNKCDKRSSCVYGMCSYA